MQSFRPGGLLLLPQDGVQKKCQSSLGHTVDVDGSSDDGNSVDLWGDSNQNEDRPFSDEGDLETLDDLESITSNVTDDDSILLRSNDTGEGFNDLVSTTKEILQHFLHQDPLESLLMFYKTKGILGVGSYFDDDEVKSTQHKKFVNLQFTCPLSGTVYPCSIATALLERETTTSTDTSLHELNTSVLGRYIIENKMVFFEHRRAARRSVCLAVLEANNALPIPVPKNEKRPLLFTTSPSMEHSRSFHHDEGQLEWLPRWGRTLDSLCVRLTHITFEECKEDYTTDRDNPWPSTLLACTLHVLKPAKLSVVGLPRQSKREAVESAFNLLLESLETLCNRKGIDRSYLSAKQQSSSKKRRLPDPSSTAVYLKPKISPSSHQHEEWYLYRVQFFNADGSGAHFHGNNTKDITQIGILSKVLYHESSLSNLSSEGIHFHLTPAAHSIRLSDEHLSCARKFHNVVSDPIRYYRNRIFHLSKRKPQGFIERCGSLIVAVTLSEEGKTLTPVVDWELMKRLQDSGDTVAWTPLLRATTKVDRLLMKTKIVQSFCGFVCVLLGLGRLSIEFGFIEESIILWNTQSIDLEGKSEWADMLSRSFPGAIIAIVCGSICIVLGFMLLLRCAIFPSNHASTKTRLDLDTLRNRFMIVKGYKTVWQLSRHSTKPFCPRISLVKGTTKPSPIQSGKETSHLTNKVSVLPFPRHLGVMACPVIKFLSSSNIDPQFYKRASDLMGVANSKSGSVKGEIRLEVFAKLLKEATQVHPRTYEKLELLGDAVLGYYLAVNIMSRNFKLRWDSHDLSQVQGSIEANAALFEAALKAGLPSIVYSEKDLSTGDISAIDTILNTSEKYTKSEISDKVISDVVESTIGATHLFGKGDPNFTIGFLNLLNLPLPSVDENGEKKCKQGKDWFYAKGVCLTSGYPFHVDRNWQEQLTLVGTAIYCEPAIVDRLEKAHAGLTKMLLDLTMHDSICKRLGTQSAKIMIMSALFDDSLHGHFGGEAITLNGGSATRRRMERELVKVAALRDTLSMVGHYAIRLVVVEDLFARYPWANEGDLTFMRQKCTNSVVRTYIMFKAGWHHLLYDQGASGIRRFRKWMTKAEDLGMKQWQKNGGWIALQGGNGKGEAEFARRWTKDTWPERSLRPEGPKPLYKGLEIDGKLVGFHDKPIPTGAISDLVFSFNAIVGALTLSLGIEDMWLCVGPLFEECLMVSSRDPAAEKQQKRSKKKSR